MRGRAQVNESMRCDAPEGALGAIGMSGRRRGIRLASVALLASIAALVPGPTVAAGNALSGGSVNPTTGTVSTAFVFSVAYTSDQGFAASSVWADVAGTTVTLALVSGTADDGTFRGSSTLPGGSWPVTFRADAVQGSDPTLAGPTVTVIGPTPTASPTPNPTPAPTPRPSRTPRPTTAPTPAPTPLPTSAPVSSAPSTQPSGAGQPTGTSSPSAGTSSAASATASARPSSTPVASDADASSPEASEEPDPAEDASAPRGSPWLFVGGGMSAIGAAILARQWARRWRHRPARG